MRQQYTLLNSGSIDGIGLHTGVFVRLTLEPAPPGHGVVFQRQDLPSKPTVKAIIENAVAAPRHTLLANAECQILTTEHILSALYGCDIDNALIVLTASEVPICDGSARPFVDLILACGISEQHMPCDTLQIRSTLRLMLSNKTEYLISPHTGLRVTCVYEDAEVRQEETVDLNRKTYEASICLARTFVWRKDVQLLQEQGLIKGGSDKNAVVLDPGCLSSNHWRCDNEIVKHKILDIIGDLSLLGMPLQAHVFAFRPGHTSNGELVKLLSQVQSVPMTRL